MTFKDQVEALLPYKPSEALSARDIADRLGIAISDASKACRTLQKWHVVDNTWRLKQIKNGTHRRENVWWRVA